MKLYRQLPVQTYRISDMAETAYRRDEQFDKRRKLMEAWAAFCEPRANAKVIPIKRGN